jgi:hypothetical protein
MGQFKKDMYEAHAHKFSTEESYQRAYKKVKKIRGFYSHLKVYLIVNAIIIVTQLSGDSSFIGNNGRLFEWHTYSTAFFWGIGLLAHGISVFGKDVFLGDEWEQKKIQELIDEENNINKWK